MATTQSRRNSSASTHISGFAARKLSAVVNNNYLSVDDNHNNSTIINGVFCRLQKRSSSSMTVDDGNSERDRYDDAESCPNNCRTTSMATTSSAFYCTNSSLKTLSNFDSTIREGTFHHRRRRRFDESQRSWRQLRFSTISTLVPIALILVVCAAVVYQQPVFAAKTIASTIAASTSAASPGGASSSNSNNKLDSKSQQQQQTSSLLIQPPRQFNAIPTKNISSSSSSTQQANTASSQSPERFPQHKPPLFQLPYNNELHLLQQQPFLSVAVPAPPSHPTARQQHHHQQMQQNARLVQQSNTDNNGASTISASQPTAYAPPPPPSPAASASKSRTKPIKQQPSPTTETELPALDPTAAVTINADQPNTAAKKSFSSKNSVKSNTLDTVASGSSNDAKQNPISDSNPSATPTKPQLKSSGGGAKSTSVDNNNNHNPSLSRATYVNMTLSRRASTTAHNRLDAVPKPMTMRAFPGIASAELQYVSNEAASARLEQVARANSLGGTAATATPYDSSGSAAAAGVKHDFVHAAAAAPPAGAAAATSSARYSVPPLPPLPLAVPAPQLYNAGYPPPPPPVIVHPVGVPPPHHQLVSPPGPEAAVGELYNPPPLPTPNHIGAAYGLPPPDPYGGGGFHGGGGPPVYDSQVPPIDPYAPYPQPYVPQQQQSYMKRYPTPHYPIVKLPPISALEIQQRAEYAAQKVEQLFTQVEPDLYKRGLTLSQNSSAALHAAYTKTGIKAKQLSKAALIALDVTKSLAHDYQLTGEQIQYALPLLPITHTVIGEYCLSPKVEPCSCKPSPFREIDGFCNNPYHPDWGRSFTAFARWLPSDYADHVDAPRTYAVSHKPLPSARAVSAYIHPDYDRPHCHFSLLTMQMGQFIDHDISHAASTVQNTGYGHVADIKCCDVPWGVVGHPSCFPIEIPYDDPFYSKFQLKCMDFRRSEAAPRAPGGCPLGPREQLNQLTSYLDASGIYGSTYEENQKLRQFEYGKMKTVFLDYCHRDILPPDHDNTECADANATFPCFKAGDQRVNEQTGLTALHTLFVREHNRLADQLHFLNPHWDDERLFQEARKISTAAFQHIVYNEWLPIVLGKGVMHQFDLLPRQKGYYEFYDKALNPSVSAVFSTAAFRYGHTLIQGTYKFFNKRHELVGHMRLRDVFFKPFDLYKGGAMDEFILALVDDNVQKRDNFLTSEITNHLFQRKYQDFGMDLAALNVQRARDHGVPSYNHWREFCGLPRAYTFYDLKDVMRPEVVERFQHVYEHVDDIDMFPAGISEEPLHDGLLGPTLTCLLTKQFVLLKKADRFWYETNQKPHRFTEAQLDAIRSTTMSSIICNNGDHIETIQPNAFLTPLPLVNERVKCESIKPLDIRPWKEITDKQIYIRDAVKGDVQDLVDDFGEALVTRGHRHGVATTRHEL